MVSFYEPLWIGKKATSRVDKLRKAVEEGKGCFNGFYIIQSKTSGELLEIMACGMPMGMKPAENATQDLVLGLAYGREEAKELAVRIIEEMYQQTGGFDLQAFLAEKRC